MLVGHRIRSAALRESTPSRKRQRRAAGFSRLGVGTISGFPNPRTIAREFSARFRTFRASQLAHANFLGRKLNFPNLTTSNRVDQGSESSISCHLHEWVSNLPCYRSSNLYPFGTGLQRFSICGVARAQSSTCGTKRKLGPAKKALKALTKSLASKLLHE